MSENVNHTIEEVLENAKKSNRRADLKLIRRAYDFAKSKHGDQLRRSGEPYIIHPVQVAYILSTLGLDESTICAALLHDVIEDTDVTLQDLSKEFSPEIAEMVDGVTKLGKLNYTSEQEQQVEEDYVDPREDLVQQLVSHQLYQEVAAKFHVMEKQRMELFSREQAVNEDVTYEVSEGTTIDLLQKAFAKLMARKQEKKIKKIKRKIIPERYTIKEEIENIEHTLKMHKGTMNFTDLFDFDGEVEVEKVVTSFLALLELVRVGKVSASQEENNGPILMT